MLVSLVIDYEQHWLCADILIKKLLYPIFACFRAGFVIRSSLTIVSLFTNQKVKLNPKTNNLLFSNHLSDEADC